MSNNYGDNIAQLPVDSNDNPSPSELHLVQSLFKKNESTISKLFSGLKDIFLLFILFVIFSIPQLNSIIGKIFPSIETPVMGIIIRGVLFSLAYLIIKNIYRIKK